MDEARRVSSIDHNSGVGIPDLQCCITFRASCGQYRRPALEVRGELAWDRHLRHPGLFVHEQYVGGFQCSHEIALWKRVPDFQTSCLTRHRLERASLTPVTHENETQV
jgi:hypothetical protein